MEAVPRSLRSWTKALAATAVAVAALGLSSSGASATTSFWNCGLLAPNTWCASPDIHTYGQVVNWNPQTTRWWCAKLTKPSDSNYDYARKCEYTARISVWSDGGGRAPWPNNSVSMRAWLANGNNSSSVWTTAAASF